MTENSLFHLQTSYNIYRSNMTQFATLSFLCQKNQKLLTPKRIDIFYSFGRYFIIFYVFEYFEKFADTPFVDKNTKLLAVTFGLSVRRA